MSILDRLSVVLADLTTRQRADLNRIVRGAERARGQAIARPLLGTMTDGALAKEAGLPRDWVRKARIKAGIPILRKAVRRSPPLEVWRSSLGKMTDSEVGRRFGIGVAVVGKTRKRLGIESFTTPPAGPPHLWDDLLGSQTDASIAREFGVSTPTVCARRNALDIPPFPWRTAQ